MSSESKFESEVANKLEENLWLLLPDDCLTHVFNFVDFISRKNVALVCKRFNKLLCFLEKDQIPLELYHDKFDDDEIFNSIMTSERLFSELTINLKLHLNEKSFERIKLIVRKFGNRFKRFKIGTISSHSSQVSAYEITENQLFALLEAMPNLEELTLRNIKIKAGGLSVHELNLQYLKKFSSEYIVQYDSTLLLEIIPKDVLDELSLETFEPEEIRFQNFLNRQSKIKTLELLGNFELDIDHLELERLTVNSSRNLTSILRKQPKLFHVSCIGFKISDEDFSAICDLKYLKMLRTGVIDEISIDNFKSLEKLTELKELSILSSVQFDTDLSLVPQLTCLSLMNNFNHLEKLTIVLMCLKTQIPEEIFIQLSQNFEALRHLKIIYRKTKYLNIILENFPLLESIFFHSPKSGRSEPIEEISDEFTHKSLKQLVIVNLLKLNDHTTLFKLVDACENLEKICLSELQNFSNEKLKHIIDTHPNLTHLSLGLVDFEVTSETIEIIKNSSRKLTFLHLSGIVSFEQSSSSARKALFEICASKLTFFVIESGQIEFVMKNRNCSDWHKNIWNF